MAIHIVTGLPGSGKSYHSANLTIDLLYRNRAWYKKSGRLRKVVSNLKMNENVENEFGYGTELSFLEYWSEALELPKLRDCDVIWEEMGATVDSRMWESLPLELRRWLAQHRHRGIEIYGNVQEFADIDVAVRRLTQELLYLTKLVGSRDPHPTSPPVKYVWGVILRMRIDPRNYKEDMKFVQGNYSMDGIMFITRKVVELYDMHNDIRAGKYPPLQHRVRNCPECGLQKVYHM